MLDLSHGDRSAMTNSAPHFVKRNANAPRDFFGCEAAGLRWLGAVDGGVPCVRVIRHDATSLTLERLAPVRPDRAAAHEFGRRLARTHDAGARRFGAAPDGWTGPGFFGPLDQPLPMAYSVDRSWGRFYAAHRLVPMVERAGSLLDRVVREAIAEVVKRCENGDFDDGDQPSRLHGDLWSGNVMWTAQGVVLIDPAAHGGHRETDLAMLALFGCPFLGAVIDGYQTQNPLRAGWQARVPLHQLHPLLAHVVLFGSGYVRGVADAADAALALDAPHG